MEEEINYLNKSFHSHSLPSHQVAYLRSCIVPTQPKRHRPRKIPATCSRQVFNYDVVVPDKSIQLCQKAFLAILLTGRLRFIVISFEGRKKSVEDARGTHDYRHNRITEDVKSSVRDFLRKYCQSHYSRNKDTKNI